MCGMKPTLFCTLTKHAQVPCANTAAMLRHTIQFFLTLGNQRFVTFQICLVHLIQTSWPALPQSLVVSLVTTEMFDEAHGNQSAI